jgi:hypothetical protein
VYSPTASVDWTCWSCPGFVDGLALAISGCGLGRSGGPRGADYNAAERERRWQAYEKLERDAQIRAKRRLRGYHSVGVTGPACGAGRKDYNDTDNEDEVAMNTNDKAPCGH